MKKIFQNNIFLNLITKSKHFLRFIYIYFKKLESPDNTVSVHKLVKNKKSQDFLIQHARSYIMDWSCSY